MPTAQNRLVVLDAWPVIEHYEGNDPASAQLTALLAQRRPRPVMSAATFTEVQYALANRHGSDAAEHEAGDLLAQADLVEIGPLPDSAVHRIIEDGFADTDRSAGGISRHIIAFAGGHPQRTMQLTDALWRLVEPGGTANQETWENALATARTSVDSGSEHIYSLLPTGQQKTLRAVATGGSIFGSAASMLDLPPGTASDAAEKLEGNGFLQRNPQGLSVVDPLLADWLRRRFPL